MRTKIPLENKIALIVIGAIATLGLGGLALHSCHVKSKLKPNAIYCGTKNNLIGFPDWSINLPKIKNSDIDGDGRKESIILYENQKGEKIYQEIIKKEDGSLVLTEPRLWE